MRLCRQFSFITVLLSSSLMLTHTASTSALEITPPNLLQRRTNGESSGTSSVQSSKYVMNTIYSRPGSSNEGSSKPDSPKHILPMHSIEGTSESPRLQSDVLERLNLFRADPLTDVPQAQLRKAGSIQSVGSSSTHGSSMGKSNALRIPSGATSGATRQSQLTQAEAMWTRPQDLGRQKDTKSVR